VRPLLANSSLDIGHGWGLPLCFETRFVSVGKAVSAGRISVGICLKTELANRMNAPPGAIASAVFIFSYAEETVAFRLVAFS
jgi:hypothetical protein